MNYEEAVNYFLDIPRFAAKKHDLSGLRRFLEELGNPDRRLKIIHVAGTNGKGSVCAFLESILREQGMKTAAFTSPHLVRVNERFRFDGESVDDGTFLEAFLAVRQAASSVLLGIAFLPSFLSIKRAGNRFVVARWKVY